ncbi:GNAT family N-acetyltransferase [Plastorhodobacter daqingensis]|uniref:GNAT family N-acetyltransferase n=1 Tax=Plastorhodobacter daqingensis TaxID=1387281 RepID=A0ABW2UQN6_9RHOB
MTAPGLADLCRVLEATWPPAARVQLGPWTIREGRGGGKRVSAASAEGPVTAADIRAAEAAMANLGQDRLFMIRGDQDDLDRQLAAEGYAVVDPVAVYLAPLEGLCRDVPPVSFFSCWPPLGIQTSLWTEAGIGAERQAVMQRVQGSKAALLGRVNDRAAGTAFIACDHDVAMLHALEVVPSQRRQGVARNILRGAVGWAQDNGANWLSLVVTRANVRARKLYASFGLQLVGHYHYRMK